MQFVYDLTLKAILKDVPKRFFKIITGFEEARFLDVQFPSIKYRQPDLLMELPDNSLWHLELQSHNDSKMDWRMLDYFSMIHQQCKKTPKQLLLYVGDKKLRMGKGILESLKFRYHTMDIREINCFDLQDSDDLGDVLLSILCRTEDANATVRGIVSRSSHLLAKERETYVLELLNLSRLRGLVDTTKKEVENMPVMIDVSNDTLYLEGTRKGLLEGKREGKREGLLEGIEGMLEIKYGAVGLKIMASVKKLESIEKMEKFKEFIKTSKTLDELRGFF
ncbi:MAG: hypothetical protein HQL06_00790 [Nitrospirae bacterium]|nr:hypothetical protein [Nitrospirota bacterium]